MTIMMVMIIGRSSRGEVIGVPFCIVIMLFRPEPSQMSHYVFHSSAGVRGSFLFFLSADVDASFGLRSACPSFTCMVPCCFLYLSVAPCGKPCIVSDQMTQRVLRRL